MNEVLLPIHIGAVLLSVFFVLRADHLGLSWILGKIVILDRAKIISYHKALWCTLATVIITGILLFLPQSEFLLTQKQFYFKIFFVGMLVINGVAIGILSRVPTEMAFRDVDKRTKAELFLVGVISTCSWLGSILCAIYLFT
jgi:hypothetical protein